MPRLFSLLLLSAAIPCAAQTYTAGRVQFSDKGTYTQQQLEAAAGIHPGSSFTQAQLGAAAQRLIDTGFFTDVGAALEGKVTAVTVRFDDKPIPLTSMLRVGFQNFVWLTQVEIEAAVHAKFPLFSDYLPENSPQQDTIKSALTEALAAKQVIAEVAYETFEPTLRHPVSEILFRVTNPAVRVGNIKLGGVSPALAPYVQKSIHATTHSNYVEAPAGTTTADRVLAPLLDAGYAAASLAEVSAAPAPAQAQAGTVEVVLSARVNAGEVYHVSSLSFAGAPLLSADAFASTAKLHAGDVASRAALLATLEPLDAAYRRQGYMDVAVKSGPVLDAAAHTVAYTVTVDPGQQYRVKELTADGLDPAAKAAFDRGFLMKTGELYSPAYVSGFLKNNTALLPLQGYSATFKAYADPATHTVDVVISFARAPRR